VVVFVGERRPVRPTCSLPQSARVHAIGDAVVARRVAHAIPEGRAVAESILGSPGAGSPQLAATGVTSSAEARTVH
jgi:pyruvate/2-oxoglutarate dehydrogenase complex dihydrolipoamide dehydrogenase (E3) component